MEAWLYPNYRSLVREATGETEGEAVPIAQPMRDPEACASILNGADGPPILVAPPGTFEDGYPRLPAPDFDPLPRIPGSLRGKLRAGGIGDPHEPLCGWWLPWRKNESTRMVILLSHEAHLVIHTDGWPYPRMRTDNANEREDGTRTRTVRWAAHVLQEAPACVRAQTGRSSSAYEDIEAGMEPVGGGRLRLGRSSTRKRESSLGPLDAITGAASTGFEDRAPAGEAAECSPHRRESGSMVARGNPGVHPPSARACASESRRRVATKSWTRSKTAC